MTTQAHTAPVRGLNYTQKKRVKAVVRILCVILVTLLFVSPLYISFVYALKTPAELGTGNPLSLPKSFYTGNFRSVITENALFRTGFVNSLICTLCIVAVLTVITPMASYTIARSKNKWTQFAYYIFMMGILIPFQCIMFPEYINLKTVKLINTLVGFSIVRTGFQIGMCIMVITNFVKSIPSDMEEAAYIDGASVSRTFWTIIFPLMKPINVTMLVINTLNAWNDYPVAVAILQSEDKRTLPLAQLLYTSESGVEVNLAFAFFCLCMIPVLILYLFAQRYIVSGIMSGAVKG